MICQCAWLLVLTKAGIKRPAGRARSASEWVVIPSTRQLARQLRRNQCRRRTGSGLSRIECPIIIYRVAGSDFATNFARTICQSTQQALAPVLLIAPV